MRFSPWVEILSLRLRFSVLVFPPVCVLIANSVLYPGFKRSPVNLLEHVSGSFPLLPPVKRDIIR